MSKNLFASQREEDLYYESPSFSKIRRFWENNINPITGKVYSKNIEEKFLRDRPITEN